MSHASDAEVLSGFADCAPWLDAKTRACLRSIAARIATLEAENARLRAERDRERLDFEARSKDYHASLGKLAAERDQYAVDKDLFKRHWELAIGERNAARADLERVTGERDEALKSIETRKALMRGALGAFDESSSEAAVAHRDLEEAVRLLRENETVQRCYESLSDEGDRAPDDPGFDMCIYCGYEVDSDDCASAGDCWGAKVRAFLASHPTPEPKEPTM